jgi:hypothetical protein
VGARNERGDEIPARLYPVFRDEEELPTDAELSGPIERALRNSRFMVVICSPRSVASKFVEDEIRTFKMLGKSDRVLAMMIRGEPNASEDAAKQREGIGPGDECFPRSLRRKVDANGSVTDERTEPVAADFRLDDGSEGWSSRNRRAGPGRGLNTMSAAITGPRPKLRAGHRSVVERI